MKHNCPSQKCSAALLPLSSLIHTLCSSPTPYQIPHTVIWMRWLARCLLCQWTCCLEQTTKSGKCTSKIWQSASAVVLPQFQHCEWAYAKSVSAYGTSAVSLDVSNCVWMQSVQVREFTQRFSLTSQVCLCTEEEEVKHCNSCHKKKRNWAVITRLDASYLKLVRLYARSRKSLFLCLCICQVLLKQLSLSSDNSSMTS